MAIIPNHNSLYLSLLNDIIGVSYSLILNGNLFEHNFIVNEDIFEGIDSFLGNKLYISFIVCCLSSSYKFFIFIFYMIFYFFYQITLIIFYKLLFFFYFK